MDLQLFAKKEEVEEDNKTEHVDLEEKIKKVVNELWKTKKEEGEDLKEKEKVVEVPKPETPKTETPKEEIAKESTMSKILKSIW